MAKPKQQQSSPQSTKLEDRFFDLLEDMLTDMQESIKSIVAQGVKDRRSIGNVQGRVRRIEAKVFKPSPFSSVLDDRKLLYLALTSIVLFLSIVAAIYHIKIPFV